MRYALWVDVREPGGKRRLLLFDAGPPSDKRLRQQRLEECVARVWPNAERLRYSGGVAEFEVRESQLVAHFAPVRDEAQLLPLESEALLSQATFGNDDEAHVACAAPVAGGVELQLRLL